MARRSRMSIVKRQRELKKAEKAATKRAKRHGQQIPGLVEPRPTFSIGKDEDENGEISTEDESEDQETEEHT